MIKRVILNNFFSFKGKNVIDLNPGINVLLGINGSGKTTFLNAFKLLYEGVAGMGFEKLFQMKWGGIKAVMNASGEETPQEIGLTYVFDGQRLDEFDKSFSFGSDVFYRIIIRPLGDTGYSLEEKLWTVRKDSSDQDCVYLDFKQGRGNMSVRHIRGIKNEKYRGNVSEQELVLRQISDPMRYKPSHVIRQAIASMGIYGTFDTNSGSKLREPKTVSVDTRLSVDGDNLVSVLNNIKNEDAFSYQRITDSLSKINPAFVDLEYNLFGSMLYLSMREKNLRHTIGLQHLSDGTLRYLLLMTILLNKRVGLMVGIDEPEGRLHPDMINSVVEMMESAARRSQLIVATHSPVLLNLFDLEDILVFEKSEDNTTVVKHFTEEDFPNWEGEMLPGQMWLHGVIGGKRW